MNAHVKAECFVAKLGISARGFTAEDEDMVCLNIALDLVSCLLSLMQHILRKLLLLTPFTVPPARCFS